MRILIRVAFALLIAIPILFALLIVFALAARRRTSLPFWSRSSLSSERGATVGPSARAGEVVVSNS